MADKPDYAPILADLERQRIEIEQAIATLRRVAGLPQEAGEGSGLGLDLHPNGTSINPHLFFGMNVPEAVRAYLAIVKRPQTASKIAAELTSHGLQTISDTPANIVRTALRRLRKAGEVVQVKKEWGLTDWFPGLKNKRSTRDAVEGDDSEAPKQPSARRNKSTGDKRQQPKPISRARKAYLDFISRRLAEGASMGQAQADWKNEKAKAAG